MNNQLNKKIMHSVYAIFILRKVINETVFKLYTIAAFAWVGTLYVSFGHVFVNMQSFSGISELYQFSVSSFVNTELIVQFLSIGMFMMLAWFIKDIIQNNLVPSFLHKQNIA